MDLFNKYNAYTEVANEFDQKVERALEPIFKEYAEKGHCPRQLAYLIIKVVTLIDSTWTLRNAMNMRKAEGKE